MALYMAFGLVIESSVSLPEMLPVQAGIPDVTINFGPVDTRGIAPDLPDSLEHRWWQVAVSNKRLLFGCRAGTYEITNGNRVTIDPSPDAKPEVIRLFLLGSALGALQIQRGRVPLHGGAIVSGELAVIITGQQGAGKSTMTSALVHNGFKYLTDDVSSVDIGGKIPVLHPAYPQRKLVRDACIQLGFDPETLPVVDTERDKFAIRDRNMWHGKAVGLGILVELVPSLEGEPLRSEKIDGLPRLGLVMNSLYRRWMHMRDGTIPPEEFKGILTVASALETFRVYVPRGIENIIKYAGELASALGLSPDKE